MSGGSFNYLCFAGAADLFQKRVELREMAESLAAQGFTDASAETESVLDALNRFEYALGRRIEPLAKVWKAVEWQSSGDWSRDDTAVEVAKYRAARTEE